MTCQRLTDRYVDVDLGHMRNMDTHHSQANDDSTDPVHDEDGLDLEHQGELHEPFRKI